MQGKKLNGFYQMIPEELTKKGGFLQNWNDELDMTYPREVRAYLEFLKHSKEPEQDQLTVVLKLTPGKPYKWKAVHASNVKQMNAGKRVRLPRNLWAETEMGKGPVTDRISSANGNLHVILNDVAVPVILDSVISAFIPGTPVPSENKTDISL